jgi:ribonuclease P protein component
MRAHFIENIDLLTKGSYVLVAKPDLLSQSFLETKKTYLYALKKCSALT